MSRSIRSATSRPASRAAATSNQAAAEADDGPMFDGIDPTEPMAATPVPDPGAPAPKARSPKSSRKANAKPLVMPFRVRHMEKVHQKAFQDYLDELVEEMGLLHWELTVDWSDQSAEDCDAQVSVVEGRYSAVLWLHDQFFSLTRDEQRRVLVHELLHMHTSGIITASQLGLRTLNKDAKSWAMSFVRDAEEHTVDALSRVIGNFVPLPPWAEPDVPAHLRHL